MNKALASHQEGLGSNPVGANKCPCTSSLNYMPRTKLRQAYGAPPRSPPAQTLKLPNPRGGGGTT